MTGRRKSLIAKNSFTEGTITEVKQCWWIKINTKHARTHSLDGAVFPDVISFKYNVKGVCYNGKKFIGVNTKGLKAGDKIVVYYDKSKPCKYALSDNLLIV